MKLSGIIDRLIYLAAAAVVAGVLVGSFAGCEAETSAATVTAESASALIDVDISIADADWDTFLPAPLKDCLKKQDDPEDTGSAPPTAAEVKSVGTVTVFVADNCGPCAKCKKDVKDYKGLTFVFRQAPGGMSVPTLQWQVRGTTYTLQGWPGLEEFIATYNRSLRQPVKSAQSSPGSVSPRSRAQVSINGSHHPSHDLTLRHLSEDHGYQRTAIAGLSREQLWTLHDQVHGY